MAGHGGAEEEEDGLCAAGPSRFYEADPEAGLSISAGLLSQQGTGTPSS